MATIIVDPLEGCGTPVTREPGSDQAESMPEELP
jgi:hypothetical protein